MLLIKKKYPQMLRMEFTIEYQKILGQYMTEFVIRIANEYN